MRSTLSRDAHNLACVIRVRPRNKRAILTFQDFTLMPKLTLVVGDLVGVDATYRNLISITFTMNI